MPDSFTTAQMAAEKKYRELISAYKKESPLEFYLTARLKYLKRAVIHSNTPNIFLFQQASISAPLLAYKRILLVIHILLYLSLFLNIFLVRDRATWIVFVFTPLLLLFFLCFIHREVEARYMLPLLPLIIIGSGYTVDRILKVFKLRKQ